MRTIKFRVWDNQNAKWAKESDVIGSMGLEFGINDYWKEENGADKCLRWDFEQFTGLKDNNRKDIYEGDILNSELNGKGIVQWDNDNSTFHVFVKDNADDDQYFFVKSYGEVIGNINENPELLKN